MRDYDRLVWPHAKGFSNWVSVFQNFLRRWSWQKRPQNKGLSVIEDDPERLKPPAAGLQPCQLYVYASIECRAIAVCLPAARDTECGSSGAVLTYQVSLLEPLAADAFIGLCAQCYAVTRHSRFENFGNAKIPTEHW